MTPEESLAGPARALRRGLSTLELPATPQRLRALAAAGILDERALVAALAAIGARPTAGSWRRVADQLLLVLGALLVVTGMLFFIAANWSAVSPHARMALVATLLAGSATVAARLGLDSIAGRVCTLVAGLLVGPLLALYGQTYQTGADAWGLFAGWAALSLGYCLVARFAGLWLFFVALLDISTWLYYDQALGRGVDLREGLPLALVLFAIHATALVMCEAGRSWAAWRAGRAFARAVATAGIVAIVVPVLAFILLEDRHYGAPMVLMATTIVVAAGTLAGLVSIYRERIPDLYMLALAGAAVATVLAVVAARLIFMEADLGLGGVFLLGIVILAEMSTLARWLRSWGLHPAHSAATQIEA